MKRLFIIVFCLLNSFCDRPFYRNEIKRIRHEEPLSIPDTIPINEKNNNKSNLKEQKNNNPIERKKQNRKKDADHNK